MGRPGARCWALSDELIRDLAARPILGTVRRGQAEKRHYRRERARLELVLAHYDAIGRSPAWLVGYLNRDEPRGVFFRESNA